MGSLALRQEFSGRYGSAWMVVQHLRVLNALTTREVARAALGVTVTTGRDSSGHARSLVDMRWYDDALEDGIRDTGSTSSDTVSFLRSRAVDAFAGSVASLLAREDVVRWCPECLRVGYHAVWFQLGALDRCPIHDVVLEEQCPHCGAPNEPCALVAASGGVFECRGCGRARVPANTKSWLRGPAFAETEARAFSALARWFWRLRNAPVEWTALKHDLCLRRNEEDMTRRCAARTQAVLAMFPGRGAHILRATVPVCEAKCVGAEDRAPHGTIDEVVEAARVQVDSWAKAHRDCQVSASEIVIGEDRILMPCEPWDEVCCVRLACTIWLARYEHALDCLLLRPRESHPYRGIPLPGLMRLMIADYLETLAILSEYQSRSRVSPDRLRAALRVAVTPGLGGATIPSTCSDGTWWVVTTRWRLLPCNIACQQSAHPARSARHSARNARFVSTSSVVAGS